MKKLNSCLLSAAMVASSLGVVNAGEVSKIVGEDRFDTAAKIADKLGSYDTAVLVNGYSTADGLSASSFAKYKKAPILLTKVDKVPETTMKRLQKADKIYLVGGEAVISNKIRKQLEGMGKDVIRLHGKDRVSTSLELAKAIGSYDKAFIVNGFKGDADAMSVAPVAARDKAPIIVTNGKTAPTLRDSKVKYYSVGGDAVVSNALNQYYRAERLSGSNRYATNKKVLEKFYSNSKEIYCANGATLVDALAVSTLASNGGVALVSKNSDKSYLEGKNLVQVGGLTFDLDEIRPGDTEDDMKVPIILSYKKSITINKGETVSVEDYEVEACDKLGHTTSFFKMSFLNQPKYDIIGKQEVPIAVVGVDGYWNTIDVELVIKDTNEKPSEKTYEINSTEFQNIARKEFYRLLDAHRAANGVNKITHHTYCEESSLMKSKDMVVNDYFSHDDDLHYPHGRGAECIAVVGQVSEPYTEDKAKYIGAEAFRMWKTSTKGHNEILLTPSNEGSLNLSIDGFSFYSKPLKGFPHISTVKATYHTQDIAYSALK